MLPAIQQWAVFVFRHLGKEAREDAVQEVIANALVAYARLVELNKTDAAYPTVLARYAVLQYFDGRQVGNRLNALDVLSRYARQKKGIYVERLDRYDEGKEEWQEAVVEDRRTPIADQAAFRIVFPAWLSIHPRRVRRIAETFALGHSTGEVAKRFHVSPGRISQKRQEFYDSWQAFQGESPQGNRAA